MSTFPDTASTSSAATSANPTTRTDVPSPSRRWPRWVRALAAVVVVLGVLWTADSVLAARAEAKLSAEIEEASDLQASPSVYLGGFPFSQVALTGELPDASVDSLDVNIEGLGIVNTRTQLYQIEIDPQDAFAGDIVGAPAEMLSRQVSLDGVALGQLLDMTDLDIANPYDISPGGGVAAEAELTGTPPGFEEQVSGVVTLRLDGPMFHMDVVEILSAPAGRMDEAADALSLSFDTRRLPLGGRATSISVSGGSIVFESQRFNTTIAMSDLAGTEHGDSARNG